MKMHADAGMGRRVRWALVKTHELSSWKEGQCKERTEGS